MEKLNFTNKRKKSKLLKTMEYYLKEHYWNLKIDISSRIINVDIFLQLVQEAGERPEYRIFLHPVSGLPDIKIKNPASFLAFCNIHYFFPIVNNIYIKNWNNVISLQDYKEFIFLIRLLHLFFIKGFDYVSYDIIRSYLKKPVIRDIFEKNNILLPSQAEFFALLKNLEDIKKSSFDIPKNVLHKNLWKLKNTGTYRENIFLEVYMKYENQVRNRLGFESTYLNPASYKADTSQKTDFILAYLVNSSKALKKTRLSQIPVQFTISNKVHKLDLVKEYFVKNESMQEFLYIQIDWTFKNEILKLEKAYSEWIANKSLREIQSSDSFPFFIKTINQKYLVEPIIIYFCMHLILTDDKDVLKIWKIENVDFSYVKIKENVEDAGENAKLRKWKIFYRWKYVWMVVIMKKNS